MTHPSPVGIHAIGVHLPDQVRKNDWWPDDVVASWREKLERRIAVRDFTEPATKGEQLVRDALADLGTDPFRGAVERRVLPDDMQTSDMEIAASRDALERADCRPEEIDLLLVSSMVPDHLATNTACTVHRGLELPTACFALTVESACNSFQQQLALAEAMIEAGRARRALLVQSCTLSRLLPMDEPYSAWFGDGATAVVVGPVADGRGVLGRADRCDGSLQGSLVTGVPGKRWFDDGAMVYYTDNDAGARAMVRRVADLAEDAVGAALAEADHRPEDVAYYACHQGFPWLRPVTQRYTGLDRAEAVDTFRVAANLCGANIPLVLAMGEREGLLQDDHVVVTHAGGSGITWSSLVVRWGG